MNKSYYAVIFTNRQTDALEGYSEMADAIEKLAKKQAGYLGFESARNEIGIAISYWETLEAIKNWKDHIDHQVAQKLGKEKWYKSYKVRICKVEREYEFGAELLTKE
jgi:heme-degrading monooxygenase HmoA